MPPGSASALSIKGTMIPLVAKGTLSRHLLGRYHSMTLHEKKIPPSPPVNKFRRRECTHGALKTAPLRWNETPSWVLTLLTSFQMCHCRQLPFAALGLVLILIRYTSALRGPHGSQQVMRYNITTGVYNYCHLGARMWVDVRHSITSGVNH